MLFNSYLFILLFLPITFIGFIFFQKYESRILSCSWIVFTSLVFYGWFNPKYIMLILISILFNYILAYTLRVPSKHNRNLLKVGIIGNLLTLAYFKYTNFFITNINELTGSSFSTLSIILPIGLSFFTFEQIAYIVDVYQCKVKKYSFLDYCYFVTFFPRLIAGPIIRHSEVLSQIEKSNIHKIQYKNICIGLSIFIVGLFKKAIIADNLVTIADSVFDTTHNTIPMINAWLGALAYTGQIYFDFSGYSDMAIGLARLFNITLPLNFNSPYKSTSIIGFWRNWNISLSRFLRDYLYIPLGGNLKGTLYHYRNLFITMLLGGLWHGASWTFVIWGGLHGTYLLINHFWRHQHIASILEEQVPHTLKLLSWLITFFFVVIAWVFFRATTFSNAYDILNSMFSLNSLSLKNIPMTPWLEVLGSLFIAFTMPNVHQVFHKIKPSLDGEYIINKSNNILSAKSNIGKKLQSILTWNSTYIWSLSLAFLFTVAIIFMTHTHIFIYYDF